MDVESTLELDSKGDIIPIRSNGTCSELIYLVGTNYEGWISFTFTFVRKGILVIMQGCIKVSE